MVRVRDPDTLRRAREALGVSQRQVAADVGCSQATLSLLERGQMPTLTADLAHAIAERLGVETLLLFDRRACSCHAGGRRRTDTAA